MLPEKTSVDKFFHTLFGGHDYIVAGDRFDTEPKLMGNIVEEASQYAFQLYTVNPIHPSIYHSVKRYYHCKVRHLKHYKQTLNLEHYPLLC